MLPFTNYIKEKITICNKNKLDISELIFNLNLSNQNLSNCIIKNLNRNNEKIVNTDFSNSSIGEENKITVLSNNQFINCNFSQTKFLGKHFFRRNKCINCNFNDAYLVNWEYQYSKFEKCTFCHAAIRIGTDLGWKAELDEYFLGDLTKYWNVEIVKKKGGTK